MPSPSLLDLPISRRGFLARSAGGAAVLALGGGCFGGEEERYRAALAPGEQPSVLGVREYAVLKAVAERIVPGGEGRPGAAGLGVAGRIDRELSFHGDPLRSDLRDALRLVEWWPLATRLRRFSALAAPDQDAELAAAATSRFAWRRSAFQGLKFLSVFFYYTREETWPGIGYQGPWVPRGPELAVGGAPAASERAGIEDAGPAGARPSRAGGARLAARGKP